MLLGWIDFERFFLRLDVVLLLSFRSIKCIFYLNSVCTLISTKNFHRSPSFPETFLFFFIAIFNNDGIPNIKKSRVRHDNAWE